MEAERNSHNLPNVYAHPAAYLKRGMTKRADMPATAGVPRRTAKVAVIASTVSPAARSLSDLGNRSENSAGREQNLSILQGNSCSITHKSGEIWAVQTDLQQICPKSDRLLA